MAAPKVFVSSTCFDLRDVRDTLCQFIRQFGFDPVLSENGDVFYHPDLHTHESCINEVGNCQLFILIIGGRFGGEYIVDQEKSVTNAEYEAALHKRIPVFTYIKRNVLESHHHYQMNRNKPFIGDFEFPSIEDQSYSKKIFEFINQVRKSSVNNAYEAFDVANDIESHLRKQWAAMFFEFLKNREINTQLNSTNKSLTSLQATSDKLEDLVKSLFKSVDKELAFTKIQEVECFALARSFLHQHVSDYIGGFVNADTKDELKKLSMINPKEHLWYKYVSKLTLMTDVEENDSSMTFSVPDYIASSKLPNYEDGYAAFEINKDEKADYNIEQDYIYKNGICKLGEEERFKVLKEFSKLHMQYDAELLSDGL